MAERLDLDARLTALADALASDASFERRAATVVERVVTRIDTEAGAVDVPRRARWHRSRLAIAAAVVVAIVAASLVISPRARRAVADLLGVRGVRIVRVPTKTTTTTTTTTTTNATRPTSALPSSAAPTRSTPAPPTDIATSTTTTLAPPPAGSGDLDRLGLGERVDSPAAAAARVQFAVVTLDPSRAGPVVATYVRGIGEQAIVTVAHQAAGRPVVLLTQFKATLDDGVFKKISANNPIESVTIGASYGYWIGGEAHEVYLIDRNGNEIVDSARLAGPTLVWVSGDVTYRLEGVADRDEAAALAKTLVAVR